MGPLVKSNDGAISVPAAQMHSSRDDARRDDMFLWGKCTLAKRMQKQTPLEAAGKGHKEDAKTDAPWGHW